MIKLILSRDDIRGPGRSQGSGLPGSTILNSCFFITGVKNYCSCAISVSN